MEETQINEEELDPSEYMPCACPYCGMDLDFHDGSGFCPGGTEEFGGRR